MNIFDKLLVKKYKKKNEEVIQCGCGCIILRHKIRTTRGAGSTDRKVSFCMEHYPAEPYSGKYDNIPLNVDRPY